MSDTENGMTAAETLHNAFRLRRNQCASLLLMPLVLTRIQN